MIAANWRLRDEQNVLRRSRATWRWPARSSTSRRSSTIRADPAASCVSLYQSCLRRAANDAANRLLGYERTLLGLATFLGLCVSTCAGAQEKAKPSSAPAAALRRAQPRPRLPPLLEPAGGQFVYSTESPGARPTMGSASPSGAGAANGLRHLQRRGAARARSASRNWRRRSTKADAAAAKHPRKQRRPTANGRARAPRDGRSACRSHRRRANPVPRLSQRRPRSGLAQGRARGRAQGLRAEARFRRPRPIGGITSGASTKETAVSDKKGASSPSSLERAWLSPASRSKDCLPTVAAEPLLVGFVCRLRSSGSGMKGFLGIPAGLLLRRPRVVSRVEGRTRLRVRSAPMLFRLRHWSGTRVPFRPQTWCTSVTRRRSIPASRGLIQARLNGGAAARKEV